MERWSGVLKVPLEPISRNYYRVGVSLLFSSSSKTLIAPSANAIFFNGDRVEGTGNPVIERLSDLRNIAEILVSKFGSSVNAWVIEASSFNGPFAIYKDFIPSVNHWGEPKSYSPIGFPASTATVSLLFNCLEEVKNIVSRKQKESYSSISSASSSHQPKIFILGFSKGGTIINQLVAELAYSESKSTETAVARTKEQLLNQDFSALHQENQIIPRTKENLINSITDIHYVDVGLNSAGAYITDKDVIAKLSELSKERARRIRFVLHGTPRQWCDSRRVWICNEKDKLVHLLESIAKRSGQSLVVCERFYFADRPPDMQMHFEVIESMDVGLCIR